MNYRTILLLAVVLVISYTTRVTATELNDSDVAKETTEYGKQVMGWTPSKPIIYHVDLRYTANQITAKSFDTRLACACLQGLVNRSAPRLFLSYTDADYNWLSRITEPGAFCEGWEVRTLTYTQAFSVFRSYINGLILFDSSPSTGAISSSLVATTAAGIECGIPIRKDTSSSIYVTLKNIIGLPVLMDISGKFTGTGTIWETSTASTGSKKCDAYIWAKQKYIDTGKCDPTVLSYTLDLYGLNVGTSNDNQLQNLDYAVMKKGFCFELSPWGDEKPNDDPNQPLGTDLSTLKSILDACNTQTGKNKMIKLCGFPNWQYKYTNYTGVGGSHDAVATEWEFMKILSAYNTYSEADAPNPNYIANASFYNGLLPEFNARHYVQNPPPTYSEMVSRGLIDSSGNVPSGNYMLMGLGDYDQASWTMYTLAGQGGYFEDTAKQSIYCNWGVDPNAIDRVCVAIDHMYRNKSSHDFFMGWDSGAGYVEPTQLYGTRYPSGYPSGVDIWINHCKKYYRALDYSITGWVFDGGFTMSATDYANYASFSGDGIGASNMPSSVANTMLSSNVPCKKCNMICAQNKSVGLINYSSGVNFGLYQTSVWTPTQMLEKQNQYTSNNHQFLDAYSYFYLLRYYLGGSNSYRATWVSDTVPRLMQAGQTYTINVTVRNDGWDTWSESAAYRLGCAVVPSETTPTYTDYDLRSRSTIPGGSLAPGESATFTVTLTAPGVTGTYDLYFDMVHDGVTWFRDQKNLEAIKTITVVSDPSTVDTDGDGVSDLTEDANGTFYWHPGDQTTLGPATPTTPTNIGAYTNLVTVTFSWTAVINAVGYICQVSTTPGGSDVYDGYVGNLLYYSFDGVEGKTYYCRIKAVNNSGYVSSWSASSDGIALDRTAPSTPAAPTDAGLYSGTSVTFNWTAATDEVSGIAGYYYRIGTTPGGSNIYNGYVGNFLTKTITGTAGSTLYCSVYAKDNTGNSGSWSASSDGVYVVSYASPDIASLKDKADNTIVGVSGVIVTGVYNGFFYVEDANRVAGIKVVSSASVSLNQVVSIAGTMGTANGERYIGE